MEIDAHFWAGRRVLVTGHTGFKGAWLSLWLQALGADVLGLSAASLAESPAGRSLYELARVGAHMGQLSVDVRDASALADAISTTRPEVLFHLAAQPVVRRSLRQPAATYEINLMGAVNLLDAVRLSGPGPGPVAVVLVTSDKCYENTDRGPSSFVEDDPLGGADPYSSSKACVELLASSYRRSFFFERDAPRVATARAGNVIGGGDWGEDRLVPDAVRAVESGQPLAVRNPAAVRPWQHVLSPLCGYLLLAQALLGEGGAQAARAWNFGPAPDDARSVDWIVSRLGQLWQGDLSWRLDERANPPEAPFLTLDSGAAERALGWRPACALTDALALVVEWHRAQCRGADMREVSLAQIARLGDTAG